MSLQTFSWRAMWRRPGRTILTLLSIVIGVAAVITVTITTAATRRAYQQMFALVTGRAALVVSAEDESPLAETVRAQVAAVPGVTAAVPVLSRLAVLYAHQERLHTQLLGVDPACDNAVRDYAVKAGRGLQGGKELLLDEAFAERMQVRVGDRVRLLTRRGLKEITVVGLLELRGASVLQHAGLVLIPLPTAQTWFAKPGQLSSLQVVVDEHADPATVRDRIAALLPAGVQIRPPAMRTQGLQETLSSSEKGLQLTTACTLLLAVFIILNTCLMNVSERRRQLSILRAIGATGGQIQRSILRETLLLGMAGTILGIAAGLAGAYVLNRALAQVLDVPMPALELSALPFVLAVLFGLGAALVGAFFPARHARRISPLEGLDRVSPQDLGGIPQVCVEAGAILTLGAATPITLAIRGFLPIEAAIVAGMFLLIGLVLLLPLVLAPLCRTAAFGLCRWAQVESSLALRQILRHRGRSTLTAGVLFVAGSGGLSMAYSILDNVHDVQRWYRQTFLGDFFIRAMVPEMATSRMASLPDEVGAELRQVPHLAGLVGYSALHTTIHDTTVMVVGRELPEPPAYDYLAGECDPNVVRQRMLAGEAVIGSVLSQRLALAAGDEITLDTQQGPKAFRICAVVNDYSSGGLAVYLHRDIGVRHLGMEGFTVYVVRAEREHLETVRQQLRQICEQHGVLLHSSADVMAIIDRMVSGIQGSLWGLVGLMFVVASFGVANTLTMNVLEQTRELGVLRIVAMTRPQVRRTVLTQALILGGVGFAPGLLAGLGYAYLLNLAMPATLGHAVEFGFHPWLVVLTLGLALSIVVLAAWLPARRAANLDPATALHYE